MISDSTTGLAGLRPHREGVAPAGLALVASSPPGLTPGAIFFRPLGLGVGDQRWLLSLEDLNGDKVVESRVSKIAKRGPPGSLVSERRSID